MLQRVCRIILKSFGWQLDEKLPQAPRYLLIAAPHTSNWDFILGMLAMGAMAFRFRWIAKDTLFFWPLGVLMRALGGIPVNRRVSSGFIEQMVQQFNEHQRLILAITPEGTRSHTRYWKSGFYHIALNAKVPVALAYIDFDHRRLGISDTFTLSGNMQRDMEKIRQFYTGIRGRYPEKQGEIRLKAEGRPEESVDNSLASPPMQKPTASSERFSGDD